MKLNIKKVATVLGSALMLGATAGMAAAASFTPSSFTDGGVAIVVGSNAALSDGLAAVSLTNNLAGDLAGQTATGTSASTVTGGDSYKIEKTSTKFQLGTYVGNITTNLDNDELPSLLKEGKYIDDDNEEFDYKQTLVVNSTLQLKMFSDDDYAKDMPTLGFKIAADENIMTYTLDMTDKPTFNKLETTNLPIMDKMYYVLDVNSANDTITLMDSASSSEVEEGATETLTVDGKTYEVSAKISSGTEVKLTVNGETTATLNEGQTRKLSDGAYVGIKDISYNAKESGVSSVEFSIGKGKLIIENGQKVLINDEDVDNVYGQIVNDSNTKLNKIVLNWTANDEIFLTEDTSLTMPGFGVVKMSFGGMTFPTTETFSVKAGGNDFVELSDFPLKSGKADIALVAKASGNTNYTSIGSDSDELVVTSSGLTLTFNKSAYEGNDEYFVASWTDGDDAESYLIRPVGFTDPTSGDDSVDFEYWDGSSWTKKYDNSEQTDDISFGNLELDVTTLNSTTGNQYVVLTGDSEISFNTLYSKEGLKVFLPWANTTVAWGGIVQRGSAVDACIAYSKVYNGSSSTGNVAGLIQDTVSFNLTAAPTVNTTTTCNASTFALIFQEENKDEDKAAGQKFNVTIGNNGASNYYASATTVNGYNSTREKSATDVYQMWTYSPLATMLVEDDSEEQDGVTITYHGGESFGDVYVLAPSATVAAGTPGSVSNVGSVTVQDTEVSSVSGKNLIVIGGSCVNSVAAELLGGAACEAAFTAKTGIKSGEALIKSFARGNKIALLVAGYNAADTTTAITYLSNKAVNTTVNAALKVVDANTATAITA